MSSGFHWVVSPDVIARGLEDYGKKVHVALHALASYWGQGIQDAARNDAQWTDRTGNARSGLFFAVDGLGLEPMFGQVSAEAKTEMGSDVTVENGGPDLLIITLGHTVFYGKYLELDHGGKYAVIMSTIEKNLSGLDRMVRDVFKG